MNTLNSANRRKRQIEKAKKRREKRKIQSDIRKIDSEFRKSRPETSKVIAVYLFFMLNAIVIYAMVAMWVFSDLTYLGVLITDIAAQIIVYSIYCLKAYHGKKREEEMKLEMSKLTGSLYDVLEAGAEKSQLEENNEEPLG